jgi:hypothetical protein
MAAGQDRRVEQIIVSVPLDPYLSLKALATYAGSVCESSGIVCAILAIRYPIIAWTGRS